MDDSALNLLYTIGHMLGLFTLTYLIANMLNHKFFFLRRDRFVLLWFTFVVLARLTLDLPFVIVCMLGGNFATSPMASFAIPATEYAKADARWMRCDPSIVALDVGSVFFEATLAYFVVRGIVYNTVYRQFCQTCASFMQVYRAWLVFGPELVSGFANISGSNPTNLILYVIVYNLIWTFVPLLILFETYLDASTGVMRFVTPYRTKSPVRSTSRGFGLFRNRNSWFWHS